MTEHEFWAKWQKLDVDTKKELLQVMEQMLRASSLGLTVHYDRCSGFFFIADPVTNTVIAPPPMNIETVAAWLDDYEKEEAQE